ncbi:hypothetical protein [Hyphomicrobium sp. D-2]|uniref:hypothetical protein n=1 Tax=Hyphomicrobium sp. D-2 TaxID=3041621 RepID=UPI0024554979|nr:hypothetical protein [Hyphomicrobium sp. D-2]MDH4981001.1 hypothetical protein [Hyphomicrobium sp. D-2]
MPRPLGGNCVFKLASWRGRAAFAPHFSAAIIALLVSTSPFSLAAYAASDQVGESQGGDVTGADDDGWSAPSASATQSGAGGLSIEGLMYRRKGLANVPFTKVGDAPNAPPNADAYVKFFSSELNGMDYTPGARVSLRASVFDQGIELSAFGVAPFRLDHTKLGMSLFTGPAADRTNTDMLYADPAGDLGNMTNSDGIYGLNVHHETRIFGAEANLTSLFGIPALSLGARAINFGETLSTSAMDLGTPPEANVPGLGTGTVRDHATIRVDNRLVGLQLGLQHMFDIGDSLRIGGSVKGGLYNNFVDRNRGFTSENALHNRAFENSNSKSVFAQSVEINPRVELKIAEGTYLTASGQFLWLNNVSTALPHYAHLGNFNGDRDVRAKDDVYFYGGSLGLTIDLDQSAPLSNSLAPFAISSLSASAMSAEDVDERIAQLEDAAAVKGNKRVSLSISGWINRMVLAWDDGAERNVYIADNVSSRSRVEFRGAAKIARGWSAGYYLSLGMDDQASNDLSQLESTGEGKIDLRHSAWWLRSNKYGTMTVGYTSSATDNIILKDTGGIMPGAANIALIGGGLIVRRADWYEQGDGALVTNANRRVDTTLGEFAAGGSVDTLRRNVIRYDAPRVSGQFGNIDASVAWGEDDFWDVAVEHSINYNDFRFRFGAGYLHDTTEGRVVAGHPEYFRDRKEYKGSASILHIPTGLFATAAYVRRTFHGLEEFDAAGTPGSIYGENTSGIVTAPGTNRPPLDYYYSALGLRRQYWSIGDTTVYGEYAQVENAITGLREAGLAEVTDSSLQMFGAAINQDIDAASMDLYAGIRLFKFDTEGVQRQNATTYPVAPAPLTDIMLGFAGARIKF